MTTPSHAFTAGLIQKACTGDRALNQTSLDAAIRETAAQGARLILLQELHDSLYFCQTEDTERFDLAESIPGPSSQRLAALAAELNIVIVASLFERRAPGLYHNTAVVLDSDGSLAGRYRKMHIPDDPGYYEKFYFTPGDLGFRPIQTSLGKLGVLICWDQWYPEAARLMALAGAEILLYPTAIGWNPADEAPERQRQLDAWITIQRAHAVANGLPLISANRVGFEADPSNRTQGAEFWGHSMICGPQGEILAQAGTDETILTARIDPKRTEDVRRIWPFFRDRRIDAYGPLLTRYDDGC
ncbi:MAG: acyltransferase [Gammaproteobacteria bacterium RIFOXYA12_FULL_61_12]|nr:MAG: acyltransferase [Gammaproteobacteria bacterium RIFOXYD12_FULL_61_37]OGT91099.1 MAG: acyltransferase [Gammaproteobacteria bacterium RIFOXYA12_FULL_61_12]